MIDIVKTIVEYWNKLTYDRKTYIGIGAAALYSIAIQKGWVVSDNYLWTLMATWTGVSVRQAIQKSTVSTEDAVAAVITVSSVLTSGTKPEITIVNKEEGK